MLRLVLAIPFILSHERFVILVTSLHRDYVPASWTIFRWISPFEIVIGLATKVILFCVLAIMYSFVADRLKTKA